jgi:cyclopropane fatty-acyl-phospholipid synthase-like methyltransferase
MATISTAPKNLAAATAPVVRRCYDLLTVAPACGLTDLTDGKYVDERNDHATYAAAQERQAEHLLDQARCGPGTRLLDIGCGYGRILEHAKQRGAQATGITISPPQVAAGRARGFDVRELNYRHIFAGPHPFAPRRRSDNKTAYAALLENPWEHAFDAIIANGSLEHFVQVHDAAAGRANEIYEEFFAICRRLLVDGGRLVTTAIHFRTAGQFAPAIIERGHRALPRGSDDYQFAMLVDLFGGWYPEPGQLERCATHYFDLEVEEDGTRDYHLTSEHWLREFKRKLRASPRLWASLGRQFWLRPRAAWEMLKLQLVDQAWAWQFRPPAPMQLWRQTWLAK